MQLKVWKWVFYCSAEGCFYGQLLQPRKYIAQQMDGLAAGIVDTTSRAMHRGELQEASRSIRCLPVDPL